MRSLEAGLVEQWKVRTWARMRLEITNLTSNNLYERPEIDVLTLSDMQMAFQLYLMFIVLSITAAISEHIYLKWYKTKVKSDSEPQLPMSLR